MAEYFTDTLGVVDLESEAAEPLAHIAAGARAELTVQRRGRDALPRRRTLLPALAKLRQLPPRRPRRRPELGPDERRHGQPEEQQEHVAGPQDPALDVARVCETTGEEAVRSGITHIQFAVRPEEEAVAIDEYLKALKPVPSPLPGRRQAQPRRPSGARLFFNDGSAAPSAIPSRSTPT